MSGALGIVVTGFSLRTSTVTGLVVGVLVGMYVIDLAGRLDTGIDVIRYASVFRYYGRAIEDGIDPLSFIGVTCGGAHARCRAAPSLFDRRDIAA